MSTVTISTILIAAGLVIIAVVILLIRMKYQQDDKEPWPFYAKNPLLEKAEQELHRQLTQALPEYVILAQVQLSQLIKLRSGYNFGKWHNRINRMSVDFVICRQDFSTVAVIELDGKSHEQAIQKQRDEKKNKALESAHIRLIRWKNHQIPDVESIRKTIAQQHEPIDLELNKQRAKHEERFKLSKAILWPALLLTALLLVTTNLIDETVDLSSQQLQPLEKSTTLPREKDTKTKQENKIKEQKQQINNKHIHNDSQANHTRSTPQDDQSRKVIGYRELQIPGKTWDECIQEYGKGIREINPDVIKCKDGYTETIPIYNK